MRAYDWQANNLVPTSTSITDNTNPGGYDAINRYGDEYRSDNPSPSSRRDNRAGMEYFYRTGYAEKGASVHVVQLMRKHLADAVKIKASGGIKNYTFAAELIAAGANRLGCSSSIQIVKEATE